MKPLAYVYTRMSTAEQLKGDSKRRQYDGAKAYAEKHGLELVPPIDDHGVSAFRGSNAMHGNLASFLQKLREGEVPKGSYLIVESLDRLSRDEMLGSLGLFNDIVASGITLVTLFDGRQYSLASLAAQPFELIGALMSFATASEESKKKSIRLGAAWRQKKEDGRSTGKPLTAIVPAWLKLDKAKGEIVAIPERVAIVQEIFRLYTTGWGAHSIAKRLNDDKVAVWALSKRSSGFWHQSYVKKIVSNRAVLGEYRPHKNEYIEKGKKRSVPDGEPVIGYYPAIIDEVTFELAAQAGKTRRTSGAGRKGAVFANLFTGLLKCRCGVGVRYMNKGQPPKGGQYLMCSRPKSSGLCNLPPIRYKVFEDAMLMHLEGINWARALGTDASRSKQVKLENDRVRLELELQRVKAEQEHLLRVIGSGSAATTPSLLLDRASKLEAEQLGLENQIKTISEELRSINLADPESYKALLEKLLDQLRSSEAGDLEVLRRTLAAEISKTVSSITLSFESEADYDTLDEDQVLAVGSDRGHMALIDYHSQSTQTLSIRSGKGLKLVWSDKHQWMKARSKA